MDAENSQLYQDALSNQAQDSSLGPWVPWDFGELDKMVLVLKGTNLDPEDKAEKKKLA